MLIHHIFSLPLYQEVQFCIVYADNVLNFSTARIAPSVPLNVTTIVNDSIPTQLLITWQVCMLLTY